MPVIRSGVDVVGGQDASRSGTNNGQRPFPSGRSTRNDYRQRALGGANVDRGWSMGDIAQGDEGFGNGGSKQTPDLDQIITGKKSPIKEFDIAVPGENGSNSPRGKVSY